MDAAFFAKLEHVLWLYALPYNPKKPVVCVDERPCFLIDDVLMPVPMESGKTKRQHYEYAKHGSCSVFVAVEPLTGKRFIKVYARRTGKEYADFMEFLAQEYVTAEQIQVVQDNLATHNASMFYAHFEPSKAFGLMQRFAFHFTPVKSSWLNMAEIELSALSRQCLNRRIATQERLEREVLAWCAARNASRVVVRWQFSVGDAREKFRARYPLERLRQEQQSKCANL